MLIYALGKVGGHACVQGAITLAAKDVDVRLLQRLFLDSGLRGDDTI